jgi:hypothetical protein
MFFLKRIKLLPKYDVNVSYQGDIILIKIKWYRRRITMHMYVWMNVCMWLVFFSFLSCGSGFLTHQLIAVCTSITDKVQVAVALIIDWSIYIQYIDKQEEIRKFFFILSSRFLSHLEKLTKVTLHHNENIYIQFFSSIRQLLNVVVLALKWVSLTATYMMLFSFIKKTPSLRSNNSHQH